VTRHRCEGPTIAAALEEAARRYGPGVTIVTTRRVRRGGIAGFFATERVEVEVETEPGPKTGPTPALAGVVGAGPRRGRDRATRGQSRPGQSGRGHSRVVRPGAIRSGQAGESSEVGVSRAAPTRVPGLRRAGAVAEASGRPGPRAESARPRREEPTLAERVLEAELAAGTGTDAGEIGPPSLIGRGPSAGWTPMPPVPTAPSRRPAEAPFADHFAAALEEVAEGAALGEGHDGSGGVPADRTEGRNSLGTGPLGTGPLGTGPLGTGPVGTGPLGTGPVGPGPVGPEPVGWDEDGAARRVAGSAAGTGRTGTAGPHRRRPPTGIDGALASLGVPAWLRAEVAVRGRGLASLAEALAERSPGRLPDSPGAVVAVVGPPADVVDAAERIAGEYGVQARAVPVVEGSAGRVRGLTPGRRVSPSELREAADRWRAGRRPKVVAVPVRLGPNDAAGGLRSLVDLDPASTLAVVSATAKLEDVAAWLCGLGGADGVLVVDAAASVTPASVLALDVPIVRLDGEPATAERWLELLVARLALTPQARHAVTV